MTSMRSRILVVDDDRSMRLSVMRLLHKEGYEVYAAESGEDAICLARQHHPDLILMDVKMPGLDGFEAGKKIKADPELKDIFLVHLSAQREPAARRMEGLESGADGYISQPVENEELLSRVRAFLRHKKSVDSLRASERRYRDLYAGNPLPMWIYDCGTFVILDVNEAAVRHFGYPKSELIGTPLADLVVTEERESFYISLIDVVSEGREKCWRYRTKNGGVREIESVEQELIWDGRMARAVLLSDVSVRNQIDRERLALLERYEREFRSLKLVSQFKPARPEDVSDDSPSDPALRARFDLLTERYVQMVERALEQRVYRVEHNVSQELEHMSDELFEMVASPRDLVELHVRAMKRLVPDPNAPRAQGYLECGRLVIIELLGHVLARYRSYYTKRSLGVPDTYEQA